MHMYGPNRLSSAALATLAVVLVASFAIGRVTGFGSGRARTAGSGKTHRSAFLLVISIQLEDAQQVEQFKEAWRPLAAYVAAHEPGTLAYEMAVADTDGTKLLVFERYRTKDDYLLHKQSVPFKEFHDRIVAEGLEEAFQARKTGQSYYESDLGHM